MIVRIYGVFLAIIFYDTISYQGDGQFINHLGLMLPLMEYRIRVYEVHGLSFHIAQVFFLTPSKSWLSLIKIIHNDPNESKKGYLTRGVGMSIVLVHGRVWRYFTQIIPPAQIDAILCKQLRIYSPDAFY